MSYNGSGTFQINTSGQPVVAGTVISSTAFNALTADLATGLSTAITKDGQTTTTVRIPFAQGISSTLTTDSSSVSTGSIITAGGVGIVKNLYVGANTNIAGTLGVTGVATFSAAPIYSSLTASSAVATDASKGLVSVTNTGTGNNVLATSPTLVTPILGTPQSGSLVNCTDLNYTGFKNRIINGAMVIDQRNAGASVSISSVFTTYTLDRWASFNAVTGKLTVQQSSIVPTGFNNSANLTCSSAYTASSAESFHLTQYIEGYNVADLGWGTANAKTITLSFWVRSSLTGTFSGSLQNASNDRTYAFTYTISVADTWEYKTVTVAGDTTGTWLTTNGRGISLRFNTGSGSDFLTSPGSWSSGNYVGATGSVSLIGTLNATWYVTGVQLEKGSTATSFDYRPYGTELALCQRYFETSASGIAPVAGDSNFAFMGMNTRGSSLLMRFPLRYAVTKRAAGSTITFFNPRSGGASGQMTTSSADYSGTTVANVQSTTVEVQGTTNAGGGAGDPAYVTWTASSEL